jgi:hypothetical protein
LPQILLQVLVSVHVDPRWRISVAAQMARVVGPFNVFRLSAGK